MLGGILIIKDEQGIIDDISLMLASFGTINHYSSLVASKIIDDEVISHYSSTIAQELEMENRDKNNVFWVIQKAW